MSNFIKKETELPRYYQFPIFLLQYPISMTAKLVYMLLFDRVRLSRKNGWVKNGFVYVNYTIKAMAKSMGKSESTVKSAYNELSKNGLLIRKDGGFSKPNELYVLIPEMGQLTDLVEKSSTEGTENSPNGGRNPDLTVDGKLAASQKKRKNDNNNQRERVIQHSAFGRYNNIFLTEAEYRQLKTDYPHRIDGLIEEMSSYLEASGKMYKNHEAALRSWAGKEKVKDTSAGAIQSFKDYTFKEGESL